MFVLYINGLRWSDPGRRILSLADWADFAHDVGGLLVEEIVYTAAVIRGDDAVAQFAIEGMREKRFDAAASTLGIASPVPKTGEAIKVAAKVAGKAEDTAKAVKSGVYHIEANGQKYTGSALDIEKRLKDPKHPAADLLKDPNAKVDLTKVDVGHLESKADKGRALRVIEQDVMNARGNVPKTDGSRNKINALTEKKQDVYRETLKPKVVD